MSGEVEPVANLQAVLDEADQKAAAALQEGSIYYSRDPLSKEFLELVLSDPLLQQFEHRLALCTDDREISATVNEYLQRSEGRYSREELEDLVKMHQEHYRQ